MQIPDLYAESIFVVQHMHPQRRRRSEIHRGSSDRHLMIREQRPTTQPEVRFDPPTGSEVPLQPERIESRTVCRVVALEDHKDWHSIDRIFKSSLEKSWTMWPGQNPSIA